jgi:predicted MPP superfamily phosphohydrolase
MFNDFICLGWNPAPKSERLVISDAPRFMRGLRIAFAADFHIRNCTSDEYIRRLTGMLDDAHADILMLGGDYGESVPAAIRLFDALSDLRFPLGTFGVMGNNDVECFGDADSLRRRAGFQLLVNEKRTLRINGGALHIGGADELKYGTARVSGLFPRSGAPCYSILISHYPRLHRFDSGARPRLMLSGHTHAGQISLFGMSCYSLGLEKGKVDCVSGQRKADGTLLVVSPGIGVSRLPIRVGAAPRIHIVDFL